MKTILIVAMLCASLCGQTAVAINGSVTVTGNPSVVTLGVAIAGTETLDTNGSGAVVGGTLSAIVNIGGKETKVELRASVAADGTRYYSGKVKVDGMSVMVGVALGHPQVTCAGMVTVSGAKGYGQSGLIVGVP